MVKLLRQKAPHFGMRQFLKICLPSYLGPLISAGLPAYLLEKEKLLHASYSTIALPSLIATILCFLLLAQFQKRQVFLFHRLTMALILGFVMIALSFIAIALLQLESETLTITSSAFIGSTIICLTTPLKMIKES